MPLPCHVPDCTPMGEQRPHGFCKRHYNLAYGRFGLTAITAGLTYAQIAGLAVVLPVPPRRAGSNSNSPRPTPAAKATPAVLAPAKLPPEAIAHVADPVLDAPELAPFRTVATSETLAQSAGDVALATRPRAEEDARHPAHVVLDAALVPPGELLARVETIIARAARSAGILADISEAADGGEAPVDKLAAAISWMGQRYARLQCEEVPALKAERDEAIRDLEGARSLVGCQEVTIAELRAALALEQEHHGHTREALDRAKAPRTDADGADLSLVARIERLATDRQSREEDLWVALGEPDRAWTWPALLARAEVCRRAAEGASTPKPKPQAPAPDVERAVALLLDGVLGIADEQGYTDLTAMVGAIRALTVGAS